MIVLDGDNFDFVYYKQVIHSCSPSKKLLYAAWWAEMSTIDNANKCGRLKQEADCNSLR